MPGKKAKERKEKTKDESKQRLSDKAFHYLNWKCFSNNLNNVALDYNSGYKILNP
jgi:hypothetical protein